MPTFVHLTPANQVKRIRRGGIRRGRWGVYCMPVVPVYYVAHQWVRELRRGGQRVLVAVYCSVPDDEPVWVGRYFEPHRLCAASEASAEIMRAADPQGYEVIVQRSIGPGELRKVRAVPQVLGWRYRPRQHERPPCRCPYCSRGDIKVQRQKRYAERLARQAASG
jgi:hypothetical protein